MAVSDFVHLHVHSEYSVLDGASTIEEYIEWCKQNGSPGLGITDHGWMIGGLELYHKCKKAGITPLPGVEFYTSNIGIYYTGFNAVWMVMIKSVLCML